MCREIDPVAYDAWKLKSPYDDGYECPEDIDDCSECGHDDCGERGSKSVEETDDETLPLVLKGDT